MSQPLRFTGIAVLMFGALATSRPAGADPAAVQTLHVTIGGIRAVRGRHKGRYQRLPGASAVTQRRLEPTRTG
jgi:hypothetical protein